jgi:hypothetical protein
MKANVLAPLLLVPLSIALAVVAIAAEPRGPSDTPAAATKLQPHEVRDLASLVLTRESAAKTPDERAAAVRDLSTLYLALARDTEMAREPKLKLKAKLYSRLFAVKQELERDVERRKEAGDYPRALESPGEAADQSGEIAKPRGGGAVRDYGETLVELIQATISPAHWDVNGGPGSIVYWPNLQVLVVRASGDAHGRVGGLFDGLRAAK